MSEHNRLLDAEMHQRVPEEVSLGRRFRALKLWCLIRSEGVEALQARLRRDINNARWLADRVRSATG